MKISPYIRIQEVVYKTTTTALSAQPNVAYVLDNYTGAYVTANLPTPSMTLKGSVIIFTSKRLTYDSPFPSEWEFLGHINNKNNNFDWGGLTGASLGSWFYCTGTTWLKFSGTSVRTI